MECASSFVATLAAAWSLWKMRTHPPGGDLESYLDRLVPDDDPYFTHTYEGPDDMPSHIKMALTRVRSPFLSETGGYNWELGKDSSSGNIECSPISDRSLLLSKANKPRQRMHTALTTRGSSILATTKTGLFRRRGPLIKLVRDNPIDSLPRLDLFQHLPSVI